MLRSSHRRDGLFYFPSQYQQEQLRVAQWEPSTDESMHPPPPPVHDTHCATWTNKTAAENSTFTYSFPINSTSLRFLSRGPLIGKVNYVVADKNASTDVINVTLTLEGAHHEAHEHEEKVESVWAQFKSLFRGSKHYPEPRAALCLVKDHKTGAATGFQVLVRAIPVASSLLQYLWYLLCVPLCRLTDHGGTLTTRTDTRRTTLLLTHVYRTHTCLTNQTCLTCPTCLICPTCLTYLKCHLHRVVVPLRSRATTDRASIPNILSTPGTSRSCTRT